MENKELSCLVWLRSYWLGSQALDLDPDPSCKREKPATRRDSAPDLPSSQEHLLGWGWGVGGQAAGGHSPWETGPASGSAGTWCWAWSCSGGSWAPPAPRGASPCTPRTCPPARAAAGDQERAERAGMVRPGTSHEPRRPRITNRCPGPLAGPAVPWPEARQSSRQVFYNLGQASDSEIS